MNELRSYLSKVLVITATELVKLKRDPAELLTRAVQPILWLMIFGQVFAHSRSIPTGGINYIDFMAPGILAQSVLFVSIFYGISIIWERDLGIVHKMLVSPTPRTALVMGKALSAGIRALSQSIIIYLVAFALGVNINWNPAMLAGSAFLILIGAALFSTFSLIIACIVKTRERFMGIGQVLTMPLFFASNAIYPLSMMPGWLKSIAHANPLTYEVDGLRAMMLQAGTSQIGLPLDFAVLLLLLGIFILIGGKIYPRIVI